MQKQLPSSALAPLRASVTSLKRKRSSTSSSSARPSGSQMTGVGVLLRSGGTGLRPVRWIDLGVSPGELRPSFTLVTGQCFHWKKVADDIWAGVVGAYAIAIKESASTTHIAVLTTATRGNDDGEETEENDGDDEKIIEFFQNYFQLNENLTELYSLVNTNL